MSENEPPLPSSLDEEERRKYRRGSIDRAAKKMTTERAQQLQGRVFDSAEQADAEGYDLYEEGVPRETVFLDMAEQLLREHGPGNWGVTLPLQGEGEEAHIDRAHLDVWTSRENIKSRIIPGTANVLRLIMQNSSEHDIDKK